MELKPVFRRLEFQVPLRCLMELRSGAGIQTVPGKLKYAAKLVAQGPVPEGSVLLQWD
jgi:hypothetical protein